MDLPAGFQLVDLGPVALAGLAVLLILTGRLVPRRTYDDIKHDRDEWRAAHRISETARIEAQAQMDEMLELGRTTTQIVRASYREPREVQ